MEHKVQVIKELNEEVVLKGSRFWPACRDAQLEPEDLKELLPRLFQMLFSDMDNAKDHVERPSPTTNNWSNSFGEPIQQINTSLHVFSGVLAQDWKDLIQLVLQDMCNRTNDQQRQFQQVILQENESQPGNSQGYDSLKWDLRTCSAKAMEILCHVFGDEILPILMPLLEEKLSSTCDEDWSARETAVSVLAALSGTCVHVLYPQMSKIVAMILPLFDDKFCIIRSKACWTFFPLSKYLVQECCTSKGREQFEKVLMGFLRNLLHTNQRVQEAAFKVFPYLEKDAGKELVPYIGVILQHLMCAFGKCQRRDLGIVYIAIGGLANSVGEELNKPAYLEVLMPQLISKLKHLPHSDNDVLAWLNCYLSISKALGVGFAPFAQPVFKRCMDIIQHQKPIKVDHNSPRDDHRIYIIVCSLQFLSQIANRLGSGIESLVSQSDLMSFLLKCCSNEAVDVKKFGFYLVGNLIRVGVLRLEHEIFPQSGIASDIRFTQYVFQRCMDIIQMAKANPTSARTSYKKKFICCSLQLLSALTVELSSGIVSLVSQSNLRVLLEKCCIDKSSDVRKDAFALLADLARVFPGYLLPNLLELLDIASNQMRFTHRDKAVANNACWVIGELLFKYPLKTTGFLLIDVFGYIKIHFLYGEQLIEQSTTTRVEESEMSLFVNCAITLGIMAWISPSHVELDTYFFFKPWCITLSMASDSIKKEYAFRGFCKVLKMNPSRVAMWLRDICLAIASWEEIPNVELKNECTQVLNIYKDMAGNLWEGFISHFDPLVKERLARFQV